MSEDDKLPPSDEAPAAAAVAASPGEASLQQCLYAVETLVQVFGFDTDAANEAVNEVGPLDINACYNYILDKGLGKDTGGAVYPIDNCPHLESHYRLSHVEQALPKETHVAEWPCSHNSNSTPSGGPKDEKTDKGTCPLGENWLCLECGQVLCSRYVNGHGLQHWKDTNAESEPGHCVAVSLADLSVWCHTCSGYVIHDSLKPLLQTLEARKFPTAVVNTTPARNE